MSLVAEEELGELLQNCQENEHLQVTLKEIGYNKLATSMQADISIVNGITNSRVKKKITKATEMRFYWVQDRVKHGHLNIF